MKMIRYVIKLKNGDYMKQEFDGSLDRIVIIGESNPIDSDLLKLRSVAERCIDEILSCKTSLPVSYEDEYKPVKVEKLNIKIN